MSKNVVAIPTEKMRAHLERSERQEIAKLAATKTQLSLNERKILRCMDEDFRFHKDKVVNAIHEAREKILDILKWCPEDTSETLTTMAHHLDCCAAQANEVDVTEFYDYEPLKPQNINEHWKTLREMFEENTFAPQEEPTAEVIKLSELKAKREEANAKRSETPAKRSSGDVA